MSSGTTSGSSFSDTEESTSECASCHEIVYMSVQGNEGHIQHGEFCVYGLLRTVRLFVSQLDENLASGSSICDRVIIRVQEHADQ